jgi:hypothetical protein
MTEEEIKIITEAFALYRFALKQHEDIMYEDKGDKFFHAVEKLSKIIGQEIDYW